MEFGADEGQKQLQITVQTGRQFIAGGIIAVQELWQVSDTLFPFCRT